MRIELMAVGAILIIVAVSSAGLSLSTTNLSVAQGNVYDIYATTPNNVTTLVASCSSFDQIQSLQAANPTNTYSGIPDPACGPITLVTSTVVSSTTFTNAVATCPPLLPGYSIICNNTTYTNTATTTMTIIVNETQTQTSTALTTTSLTITQSGTVTQTTATVACQVVHNCPAQTTGGSFSVTSAALALGGIVVLGVGLKAKGKEGEA